VKKIGILNLSSNNINSVKGAFEKIGCDAFLINSPNEISKADLIVLPGVGAFPEALEFLKKTKLKLPLMNSIKKGKKILGICLGMQILASSSDEIKFTKGLNLLSGKIKKMKYLNFNIGWSKIKIKKKNIFSEFHNKNFYFNHQFKYYGKQNSIFSSASVGKEEIPSIVIQKNLIGVQFHPEKSQENGLKFLKELVLNF
jgi:imidazole glycerol-phosphate synthase subunit HisH